MRHPGVRGITARNNLGVGRGLLVVWGGLGGVWMLMLLLCVWGGLCMLLVTMRGRLGMLVGRGLRYRIVW